MRHYLLLALSFLCGGGLCFAREVVSAATSATMFLDTTVDVSEAKSARFQTVMPIAYSDVYWSGDITASGSVKIKVNGEVVAEESGEGVYEWAVTKAGVYSFTHEANGLVVTKTVRVVAPGVVIERSGDNRCVLTATDGESEIRYTTDGSEPTKESALYTAPFELPLLCMTSVRACTFGDGYPQGLTTYGMFGKAAGTITTSGTTLFLDTRAGKGVLPIDGVTDVAWSVVWKGLGKNDNAAEVVIEEDGKSILRETGEGVCSYCPSSVGSHVLTHTTYKGGSAVGDPLTATLELSPTLRRGHVSDGTAIIPAGVTEIGEGAFAGCADLHTVSIPTSVDFIGQDAFLACENLKRVDVESLDAWLGVTFANAAANPMSCGAALYVNGEKVDIVRVTFDTNGGEDVAPRNLQRGVTVGTLPRPVRGSDEFSGWFTKPFGGEKIDESYTVQADVTFYAHWLRPNGGPYTEVRDGVTWTFMVADGLAKVGTGAYSKTAVDKASTDELQIPNELGGRTVAAISDYAFYECVGLTSVIVPDSVTHAGYSAFNGCSGLTNVTISSGLMSISDYMFAGCSGLTSIVIPDSVTDVGYYVFEGCYGLTNVVVGNGMTTIGVGMFYGCAGLTSMTIPNSVTSVEGWAFNGCSGLTSVIIPDSVVSIGYYAFVGCNAALFDTTTISGLKLVDGWVVGCTAEFYGKLNLDGVRGVCDRAFYGCNEITSVVLPNSMTRIGYEMFANCTSLASVTIPNSVIEIDDWAFKNCSRLANVTLPDSVKDFGRAFQNCTGLKNIVIGKGVANVDSFAFKGCDNLATVTIIGNGSTAVDSYAFEDCKSLTGVSIGDGVASIDSFAFRNCRNLTNVSIGDGVASIGIYAFDGCSNLSRVSIGKNVTSIGSYAFNGCGNLESVSIGNGVETIGHYAFYGCRNLEEVTIPALVTDIGVNAFGECAKLSLAYLPKGLNVKNVFPSTTAFYRYTPIQTVRLNANGGICSEESVNVIFGNVYGDLPVSTRDGCSFGGWFLNGVPISSNTIVHSFDDHELVARWECAVMFDANGGVCTMKTKTVSYGTRIGSLPVPTRQNAAFVGWFTEAEGGEKCDQMLTVTQGMTLYAHWLFEVSDPVITSNTGTEFRMDCEVSITSATAGAKIYYTDDGTTPKKNGDYLYSGPILITETTTFKAIAVVDGLSSGYVTVTITKRPISLAEALGVGDAIVVATSEVHPWIPVLDSTVKECGLSVRSGVIGNGTSTWLSASVSGGGTMSFRCKSSCEHDDDDAFTWDRLMVFTNGVEITDWRMDGETDWTERTLMFGGGENTVKWVYYKDNGYAEGEDCAWVSSVKWTPADPFPDVLSDDEVVAALAGSTDVKLFVNITDVATYNEFREWALKIGATDVKASPFAWVSFATDGAALLAKMPADDDLKVEEFKPSATAGLFDFTVSVKDVTIGDKASKDNLKKLFGLEGGESLDSATFSSDNVALDFKEPQDGKLKFTATPAVDNAKSFFMKVKVK